MIQTNYAQLSLPRASDATRGGSRGVPVRLLGGVDLAMGDSGDVGELGVLEGAGGLAAGGALAILLVGGDVEGNEEEEV